MNVPTPIVNCQFLLLNCLVSAYTELCESILLDHAMTIFGLSPWSDTPSQFRPKIRHMRILARIFR